MIHKIEQYPKFKDGKLTGLSDEQKAIRKDRKHRDHLATDKTCKTCATKLPICEYWFKDKKAGRRSNECKDCMLRAQGVVEIGKIRFSRQIKSKGFKRCSGCKEILPHGDYHPSNVTNDGYATVCKQCSVRYTKDFVHRQRDEISDYYVKQRFKETHGRNPVNSDEIELWRKVLIDRRATKYSLDGKEFISLKCLTDYVFKEYGQPITQTIARVRSGCEMERLYMPQSKYRSQAYSRGRVKMVDTVSGEVLYFDSVKEVELKGYFCAAAVDKSISSGLATRITKRSKYPNPVIFFRV